MSAPARHVKAAGEEYIAEPDIAPALPDHATLAQALVAAQSELPKVEPDAVNPHFRSKFVSLGHLISKVRPVLNRHGVSFQQFPITDEHGQPALITILRHSSGEDERFTAPLILTKQDPQGQGSAITYMRRYALASALGVSDQEDDDGNGASPPEGAADPLAATPPQKRAITTALNKAGVSKDFQRTIVLAFADPLTKQAASRILDVLNDEALGSLEERTDALIEEAKVERPSDIPEPDESDLDPPPLVGPDDPEIPFA